MVSHRAVFDPAAPGTNSLIVFAIALGFIGLLLFTAICLVVALTMRRAPRMSSEAVA